MRRRSYIVKQVVGMLNSCFRCLADRCKCLVVKSYTGIHTDAVLTNVCDLVGPGCLLRKSTNSTRRKIQQDVKIVERIEDELLHSGTFSCYILTPHAVPTRLHTCIPRALTCSTSPRAKPVLGPLPKPTKNEQNPTWRAQQRLDKKS
jgi:hypothetical protein